MNRLRVIYILAATMMLSWNTVEAQTQSNSPTTAAASPQLSPQGRTAQLEALEQIEQRARQLAGKDSAKYTALLRQGMARLPLDFGSSDRTLGRTIAASLEKNIVPTTLDRDPGAQAIVQQTIDDAKKYGVRMVGARDAEPGAYPQVVAIVLSSSETGCSGVVVAPGAVLTAAHCVCLFDLTRSRRQIAFGDAISSSVRTFTIPASTRIFPDSSVASSQYCASYKTYNRVCQRDLALLRYDGADTPTGMPMVRFASKSDVAAALDHLWKRLPGAPLPFDVVGFGTRRVYVDSAKFDYGDAGRKRVARFTFFRECQGIIPLNCPSSPSEACLEHQEISLIDQQKISDSCSGDSGGPAFVLTGAGDWRLAALVSRALKSDGQCGPGGLYSYVNGDDVEQWLHANNVSVTR